MFFNAVIYKKPSGVHKFSIPKIVFFIVIVFGLIFLSRYSKASTLSVLFAKLQTGPHKTLSLAQNTSIPAYAVYLYNQNYNESRQINTTTYLVDPETLTKKAITIGYDRINSPAGGSLSDNYSYRTSPDGRYLLRHTDSYLDISSYTNPEIFHTVVTQQGTGSIGVDYRISSDDSKIAWASYSGGYKGNIYISNISNGVTKLIKSFPNAEVSMVAFDNINHQIYYYLSYGYMGPYDSQVLTMDNNDNIIAVKSFDVFSFLSAFSPDFNKIYDGSYDLSQEDILTQKRNTLIKANDQIKLFDGGLQVSPDGNNLLFFETGIYDITNTPFIMNLIDHSYYQLASDKQSYDPDDTYYDWSPDGKYFRLSGSSNCISCADYVKEYIYNLQKKNRSTVFTLGHKTIDPNTTLNTEVTFIGWLRKQ